MRIDSLVRAINAADFMAFRQIAMLILKSRGFERIELRDGWKDGGSDLSVWFRGSSDRELAVQVTVQQQYWKSKLRADAQKVKQNLNLDRLIYITSRRIPPVEFEGLQDAIWTSTNVQVSKIDGPAIASHAVEKELVGPILKILGIDRFVAPVEPDSTRAVQDEVAFALSLFNPESRQFRQSVIETGVAIVLQESGPMSRMELRTATIQTTGLGDNQASFVDSAIDRMQQDGRLEAELDLFTLSDRTRRQVISSRSIRSAQWAELRESVTSILREYISSRKLSSSDVKVVLGTLGSIIMATARSPEKYLDPSVPHATVRESVKAELGKINSVLDSLGFAEGAAREALFHELAGCALSSSLARHLLAGQFYVGLASMDSSALTRAFGTSTPMTIVLDSSVTIPLLASLMYQATDQELSQTAMYVYAQAQAHRIVMTVPRVYLEETAAHLIDAHRHYSAILDADVDMGGSTNGFVAHFSTLRAGVSDIEFDEYVRNLGFNKSAFDKSYYSARDLAMKRQEGYLKRYGIEVSPFHHATAGSQKKANEILDVALHEKRLDKPEILQAHDRRVLGFLLDTDTATAGVRILCTWDNFHFFAREYMKDHEPLWDVLDPGVLGDLLASVSVGELKQLQGILGVVLAMEDDQAALGYAIWDVIARIEGEGLFDAELLNTARQFQADYFAKHRGTETNDKIRLAWSRWKSEAGFEHPEPEKDS